MTFLYYSYHAWHTQMQGWNPFDFKVENDVSLWCWFVNAEGGKLNQEWVRYIRAFAKPIWEFTTLQTNIYIYNVLQYCYILLYTYYILDTHRDRESEERERGSNKSQNKIPVPGIHLLKSWWSVCSRDMLNNADSCYMFYLCSLAVMKQY